MKTKFLFLVLTCLAFFACQDYDNGLTDSEIHYMGKFHQAFGTIDPSHDFNLAERNFVTVDPGQGSHIRVFVESAPQTWTIVADYDSVFSSKRISFDVVEGTDEVVVTNGISAQRVPVGSSVNFTGVGTRAGMMDYSDETIDIHLNEGMEYSYYYYDLTVKDEIAAKLPENKRNRDMTIQNFTMVSNGEFVVYPVYWYCGALDYIGIYYYDENGTMHEHMLFGNHTFNESVQFLDSLGNWDSNLCAGIGQSFKKWNGMTEAEPYLMAKAGFEYGKSETFRSKGIVVNLPVGTVFGFYMDPRYYGRYTPYNLSYLRSNYPALVPQDAGQYKNYYSDADLNPLDCIATPNGRYADTIMYCFATWFDSKGDLVVCGEDGIGGDGTWPAFDSRMRIFDYNDIAFKIYGTTPTLLSNTATEWMLPFEDLGNNFDLDFNDIILKMSYVSGADKAYITPLAAGGTLHSQVKFNDTNDETKVQNLGEIHVLLGATQQEDSVLYEPINADSRGTSGKRKTVTVNDPENFSVANAYDVSQSTSSDTQTQGVVGVYIETQGTEGNSIIAYNGMGKIPAMLVLPTVYHKDNHYYEWAWPKELQDIRESYNIEGHSFAEWIADRTKATDWYMYPNGNTVEEKSYENYINSLITDPEYEDVLQGTIVALPSKVSYDTTGLYVFDAAILENFTTVTLTAILKGVVDNSVYVYSGTQTEDVIGIWSRIGYDGTIAVIGNNSTGEDSGSTSFEGIYSISLTADEVEKIRAAGQFAISAGDGSTILALAMKS